MSRPIQARQRGTPTEPEGLIVSRDNRWLTRFRAVLARENLKPDGTVGIEGVRLVEAAFASDVLVEALLVSESGQRYLARLEHFHKKDVPLLRTTDRLFAGVADTRTPQGIAALVRVKPAAFEDVLRGIALVVVLAGVQDPGNVGTLLRAAEAFGATGAIVCEAGKVGTANPFAPKAMRASAGAALRLPILNEPSLSAASAQLRGSGVRLYAAVPEVHAGTRSSAVPSSTIRSWDADWKSPAALLIGNEGAGLPDELIQMADARVRIPQVSSAKTGVESLNAAMAGAILLYEAMRQRTEARQTGKPVRAASE